MPKKTKPNTQPAKFDLQVDVAKLLSDAKAAEQNAIDNLPKLVECGALSQEEADGVRELCERAIAQIDSQAARI